MMRKSRGGSSFYLERSQTIPNDIEEVFEFFSNPANLESITPPWLHFRMVNCSTPDIRAGTTLDYRLRVHGLPFRWRSLISMWRPPFEFIDEQVRGPYRFWTHHHSFRETDGGVVVRDRVEYSVHGGAVINELFVRRDLKRIFDHRQESLSALLPKD